MENLEALDIGQLLAKQADAQRRLAELSESFMRLRAGGCALEAQIDAARVELKAVEDELRKRWPASGQE
jgi:hypothetical protein